MQSLMPRGEEFGINDVGAGHAAANEEARPGGASPQERFGHELRGLRLEQGLLVRKLGRLVQVSDDMILAIEKGK
ncbi:helix-turn-helix domain-containing protein [Streptomyces albidoflavus]